MKGKITISPSVNTRREVQAREQITRMLNRKDTTPLAFSAQRNGWLNTGTFQRQRFIWNGPSSDPVTVT